MVGMWPLLSCMPSCASTPGLDSPGKQQQQRQPCRHHRRHDHHVSSPPFLPWSLLMIESHSFLGRFDPQIGRHHQSQSAAKEERVEWRRRPHHRRGHAYAAVPRHHSRRQRRPWNPQGLAEERQALEVNQTEAQGQRRKDSR